MTRVLAVLSCLVVAAFGLIAFERTPASLASSASANGPTEELASQRLADVFLAPSATPERNAVEASARTGTAIERRLRVLSGEGSPLSGVSVVRARRSSFGPHPGPADARDELLSDAASPIAIDPAWFNGSAIWVRADGHAWRELPPDAQQITLVPGGDLAVRIENPRWDLRAAVQVAPPDTRTTGVEVFPLESPRFVLDGLPAGTHEVRLTSPGWSTGVPLELTRSAIEAGAQAEVTLAFPAVAGSVVAQYRLGGEILLPPELLEYPALWEELNLLLYEVSADGRRETRPRGGIKLGRGARRFALAQDFEYHNLHPGSFEVVLHPLGYVWPVLLDGNREDLSIAAAPPARTLVDLYDVADGAPVHPSLLTVTVAGDRAAESFAPGWLHDDPERDTLEVLSSPGRLRLFLTDARFGALLEEFDVHAGWNQHHVGLQHTHGIELRFFTDTGEELTAPAEWWLGFEVLATEPGERVVTVELVHRAELVCGLRLGVSAPGAYRLIPPPLSGHAVPGEIQAEVGSDAPAHLRVPLEG